MNRREFLATAGAASLAAGCLRAARRAAAPVRPVPTPAQLRWQRDELALFLHFGVNTFTDREWGDGKEDPALFNPGRLDARQWARVASVCGFRAMILTAKHHDGFCLWPSATTRHSVGRSPWRAGQGDVVREFVDACRAEGLRAGLYLSPWDRNHPTYGDSPKYMDVYIEQLTELCTKYGPLAEVWFDGANGEGPNGKRQVYDWPRIWGTVRRLQPDAVMFSDAGPDVRWCGNERGTAGDPNWSMMRPDAVPHPGADGPGIIASLQNGYADGTVWRPAEVDVSIRPGWFYHPAQDDRVRTVENLVDLYYTSVGRNSKLLLNVPPTPEGLIHATDVSRLYGMRARLREMFRVDLARGAVGALTATGPRSAAYELDLRGSVNAGIARLSEHIEAGQVVARYALSALVGGQWRELSRGTTIGYAKLDRFPPVTMSRVRVTIEEALEPPAHVGVSLYA